jgi:DNA-binding response OmpR family regulator
VSVKVLIVEDNQALNRSMQRLLSKEGFAVSTAFSAEKARNVFQAEKPDIVLLDIMLPQEQGHTLIPYLRAYEETYILMLSALDDPYNKQFCYSLGADDYMAKPFDMHELLYKLQAVGRRVLSQKNIFRIGDIILDMEANQVQCQERTIPLQPSQAKLLKALYQKYHEHTYLPKHELSEWHRAEFDTGENPRMHTLAARLRKSLSELGCTRIMIESVYGKGYQLIILPEE